MRGFSLHLYILLSNIFVMSKTYIHAADNILINCGAPHKTTSMDGREWGIDSLRNTSTSVTTEQQPSIETPYTTARIFTSNFTYTIPVSGAGQKFLRLYFYPANYSNGYDMAKSFFNVDAANHNLLSNFSASLNLDHPSVTLVKEYVITVVSRVLKVTFSPSPGSYAFVNGIEVVSIPEKLYINGEDAKFVGQNTEFSIIDSMALEKFYRLNVGGPDIPSTNDSGMFRSWVRDQKYLLTSPGLEFKNEFPIKYTPITPSTMAPATVYFTARSLGRQSHGLYMRWSFQVDSGFNYLLRLFFCEIDEEVIHDNTRVFSIFINNQTAEEIADVSAMAGGEKIPFHKDYVVMVIDNPNDSKSKTDLLLTLRPNMTTGPLAENTILNGLEIFKLSVPGGSLASPNPPDPQSGPSTPSETGKDNEKGGSSHSLLVGACIGGSCGVIILFLLIVGFLLFRRKKNSQNADDKSTHDKSRSTTTNNSSLPSVRSRKFSLKELKFATSDFDENFVIGAGGFGNVYKGYLDNGAYPVAIKRLNQSSRQGVIEFQTEIRMLSNLRHLHLVPLIGYCDEGVEMILVYDYMVNGTLRSHLYRGDNSPLSWKQRLQICIGAAKGLHYLHEGAERVIMHRDVKSTNILLDEKMIAKVSDFGLSKMGPSDTSVTHVSTIVKGTMGYLDPEYYRRHQLTTKSDVFSFGVVLFEVLCARPVIMQQVPKEQVNLSEWARNCHRKGILSEIVDKNLMGEIAVESLNKFAELACNCIRDRGTDRPSMSDVVWSLEFALQLQESYEDLDKKVHPSSGDPTVNLVSGAKDDFAKDDDDFFSTTIVAKASETSTTSTSSDQMKSGSVFSEILNPNAR